MKKSAISIVVAILLLYSYQGFLVIRNYFNDNIKITTTGQLSEITKELLSITLETPDSGSIEQIRHVSKDGKNIFLFGDERLLQFNTSGKFIRQIKNSDNSATITNFTLDTDLHKIIVIDSQRNISEYDYNGNLIAQKRLEKPWHRITAIAYHKGFLWVTAETQTADLSNSNIITIHQKMYQLDAEMHEISQQELQAKTEYKNSFSVPYVEEIAADDDNNIYAYTPPYNTERLLEDSLQIISENIVSPRNEYNNKDQACILPVRKGSRYMISTKNGYDGYTFCYDRKNHKAYQLSDGFYDDINKSGYIKNLHPLDIYGKYYCFTKSGKEAKDISGGNAVLFIVTLNS